MSETEQGDGDHTDGSWQLTDSDRELLDVLRDVVRRLSITAASGDDLIAIGEAWEALDAILDGEPVEVNVELTLGFRCGNDVSEEGFYVSLRVNNEEVRLSRMNTTWDKQIGSDNSTSDCAVLTPDGAFYPSGGGNWLSEFAAIKSHADATLSTSRDHV